MVVPHWLLFWMWSVHIFLSIPFFLAIGPLVERQISIYYDRNKSIMQMIGVVFHPFCLY